MEKQRETKYRIKENDQVKVISGKDRGKAGRVIEVDAAKGRVLIEGLNMVKKALRPKGQTQKGGIISVEAPLHISKVMIVCKKCGATRAGYRFENESKVRFCKKCGEQL